MPPMTSRGSMSTSPTLMHGSYSSGALPPRRESVSDGVVEPEYLKHVFLKFLDDKGKRGQLLPVLGMLLGFSEGEMRNASRKI
jgi:hypothetical protein